MPPLVLVTVKPVVGPAVAPAEPSVVVSNFTVNAAPDLNPEPVIAIVTAAPIAPVGALVVGEI